MPDSRPPWIVAEYLLGALLGLGLGAMAMDVSTRSQIPPTFTKPTYALPMHP